jgi:hypothetical protein
MFNVVAHTSFYAQRHKFVRMLMRKPDAIRAGSKRITSDCGAMNGLGLGHAAGNFCLKASSVHLGVSPDLG